MRAGFAAPASGTMAGMSASATLPRPSEGERGLASHDPDALAGRVAAAWDAFLRLADAVDLEAPSRLPGWRAREVLVHLGTWPGHSSLQRVCTDAREGVDRPDLRQRDLNAAIFADHLDASRAQIVAALERARDDSVGFVTSPDAEKLGLRPVRSVLGPLPALSLVTAATYELAVHALDLAPAGAPRPDPQLLDTGLAAVVDVTAALAAREGIEGTMAALTPEGGWVFSVAGGDWTTMPAVPAERGTLPGVEAPAAVLLDVAAGRVAAPPLVLNRTLRLQRVSGLLVLTPLIDKVPGLPGGAMLRLAARSLGGVNRLVRRLPLFG